MAWLEMTDVRAPCALRLRFILDTPIPLCLGYRLLVTATKFHHRDTEGTKFGTGSDLTFYVQNRFHC